MNDQIYQDLKSLHLSGMAQSWMLLHETRKLGELTLQDGIRHKIQNLRSLKQKTDGASRSSAQIENIKRQSLYKCELIQLSGRSYRMANRKTIFEQSQTENKNEKSRL